MSYIFNNKKLTYNDKWLGRPYITWLVANYGTIVTGNPKVYAGQTSPFTVVPAEGYDYCRTQTFSGPTLLILYKFPYPTSSLEVTTDLSYNPNPTWYTFQCVGDVNFDIDTNNPTTPNTFRLKYKPNTSPTINLNGGPNTYTVTLVDAVDNIYDITNTSYDWNSTLKDDTNLLEIVGFMPYGTNQWGETNKYLTRGLNNTFEGCTSLTSLPAKIDLSGIGACTYTFKGCTSLVNLPVYASYMPLSPFNNADLTGMFYGCTSLVHLPINNACKQELGRLSNTSYMFYGCTSLVDTLPYGCYNDASYMYYNCKNIESATVNINNSINCESMFEGCTKLKTVNLTINKWSKVKSKRMFMGCTNLTSIILDTPADYFDTVFRLNEDSRYMFADCAKLSAIPTLDTSTVEDARYMYRGCTSITTVPLLNLSSATYIAGIFKNCYYVQSGALALYQQTSTQANPPRVYAEAFMNCGIYTTTGAAELAQIPSDWK